MLRQHVPSQAKEMVHAISLDTYTSGFEYETIRCVHCGDSMLDYYDLNARPYDFKNFQSAYKEVARNMSEVHGMDRNDPHIVLSGDIADRQSSLHICQMCGWWTTVDRAVLPALRWQVWLVNLVAPAALAELDMSDLSTPLREVRNFLRRRYDARHTIAPRLFEQAVASVFRDMGYEAETTAYSNDGGIDVVLRDREGARIGVQVKRRGRAVEVEQIRAFLGALMLGGFARGVFVSTSGFQRGAIGAADVCRPWATVELMNAERFFDALGIAQLKGEVDPDTCGFQAGPKPQAFLHSSFHLNSL